MARMSEGEHARLLDLGDEAGGISAFERKWASGLPQSAARISARRK